jgi:hypothetical protein
MASPDLTAGDIEVEKRGWFRFLFSSYVSDIFPSQLNGSNVYIVLAQSQGVVLDEQRKILKEFNFPLCSNPKVTRTARGQCVVYCRGGGFSPVRAVDLDGNELWRFNSSNLVHTVVLNDEAEFFVCTAGEVSVLDQDGKLIRTIKEEIYDIHFVASTNVVTISAPNRSRRRQLDFRDGRLKIRSSVPIDNSARNIVAYDWPNAGSVCYISKEDLVVLGKDGKVFKRVSLEGAVVGPGSTLFQDELGNRYLALLARYTTERASTKLFIFSDEMKKVYEEVLPISFAVSTLNVTNRLYVGYAGAGVIEYRLRQKQQ